MCSDISKMLLVKTHSDVCLLAIFTHQYSIAAMQVSLGHLHVGNVTSTLQNGCYFWLKNKYPGFIDYNPL